MERAHVHQSLMLLKAPQYVILPHVNLAAGSSGITESAVQTFAVSLLLSMPFLNTKGMQVMMMKACYMTTICHWHDFVVIQVGAFICLQVARTSAASCSSHTVHEMY